MSKLSHQSLKKRQARATSNEITIEEHSEHESDHSSMKQTKVKLPAEDEKVDEAAETLKREERKRKRHKRDNCAICIAKRARREEAKNCLLYTSPSPRDRG